MARTDVKLVRNKAEYAKFKKGLGFGMLNFGFDIQRGYQESFQQSSGPLPRPASKPGQPPAAQTGNLRRSAHTVLAIQGAVVSSQGPVADYSGELNGDLVVIVGTNTGYGLVLEVGSSRMAARPALVPAAQESQTRAHKLIEDGARAAYHPSP